MLYLLLHIIIRRVVICRYLLLSLLVVVVVAVEVVVVVLVLVVVVCCFSLFLYVFVLLAFFVWYSDRDTSEQNGLTKSPLGQRLLHLVPLRLSNLNKQKTNKNHISSYNKQG